MEAAQRKLGQFSLPRPTAWILKFIQCANELQCERLDVALTEQSVRISFPPGALPSLSTLHHRLDVMRPENQAESHLFSGLSVLMSMPGRLQIREGSFQWDANSDDSPVKVDESVPGLKLEHQPEGLNFWERLRARLTKTVGILDELELYAYASPVPIYVDAVPLHQTIDSIALLNGVLTDQSKTWLKVGGSLLTEDDDRSSVFCDWGANRARKYSSCVRIEHRRRVTQPNICLDWVRSGVVVKREGQSVPKSDGLLSRTLVPADGFKFDLSGFDFGESEESRYRRRRGAFFTWYALRGLEKRVRPNRWGKFLRQESGDIPTWVLSAEGLQQEVDALVDVLTPPSSR
jgi:hypothetical protein